MTSSQVFGKSKPIAVPQAYSNANEDPVLQKLVWGDVQSSRSSPAATIFTNTGRKLYVIGDVDGGFRPRSNPYDLHNFGAALPNDPLANKLQGVWAQPVKALNAYSFLVQTKGETWPLLNAESFTQSFVEAEFVFQLGTLSATRTDFTPQDRPMLFTSLKLHNASAETLDLRLAFFAYFDLEDAWFTSLAEQRNQGEIVTVAQNRLTACASSAPDKWAVIISGDQPDAISSVRTGSDGRPVGQLEFTTQLGPNSELVWTIGIVVETALGAEVANQNLSNWLAQKDLLRAEKRMLYESLLVAGPRFHSPNAQLDTAFDLARANLQMLEAESPALGTYFYAGLENFPFWFTPDGPYSGIALLATGLVKSTLNHLRIGARFSQAGRIPHQISPSGKIVANGNAQESPHWILALWDAYRRTANDAFLAEMYPAALTSLFDYTLGTLNVEGDAYPSGAGIVEKEDMGPKKLDTAAYTWAALNAIAQMAEHLGDSATAKRSRSRAEEIAADFDKTWWDAANGTYTMSIDIDQRQMPAPHWAVIVPLEVGLASPQAAARTFATLKAQYMNTWGLKHTVGEDERVWTLPTALLSQAAYRYGEPNLGFEMLCRLSETLNYGSIGMYHELIPDGLCFLQLWSGAEFVRGVVEDLLGIKVQAHLHTIRLRPQLPTEWDFAELEHLRFANHLISIRIERQTLSLSHLSGLASLTVVYQPLGGKELTKILQIGETIVIENLD